MTALFRRAVALLVGLWVISSPAFAQGWPSKPVTVIVVATGVALGARAGIGVGAAAAFVSNFFLGQGLWTPWQMLAWGGCGAVGALLAPLLRRRIPFAIVCCLLGFAFVGGVNLLHWRLLHQWHDSYERHDT